MFIVYSYGLILLKKIFKIKNSPNFYETSIIGLIFTVPLSQFIFFCSNDYTTITSILLLIIFFIFNKEFFRKFKN